MSLKKSRTTEPSVVKKCYFVRFVCLSNLFVLKKIKKEQLQGTRREGKNDNQKKKLAIFMRLMQKNIILNCQQMM